MRKNQFHLQKEKKMIKILPTLCAMAKPIQKHSSIYRDKIYSENRKCVAHTHSKYIQKICGYKFIYTKKKKKLETLSRTLLNYFCIFMHTYIKI